MKLGEYYVELENAIKGNDVQSFLFVHDNSLKHTIFVCFSSGMFFFNVPKTRRDFIKTCVLLPKNCMFSLHSSSGLSFSPTVPHPLVCPTLLTSSSFVSQCSPT